MPGGHLHAVVHCGLLGPDHLQTLTSRNNLAGAYQWAGRLLEAMMLYEQVLADRERVLGPDHPDTLGSRNDLAGADTSAAELPRIALDTRVIGVPAAPGAVSS